MKIAYFKILKFLNDYNNPFVLHGSLPLSAEDEFTFASTKNIIEKGIYYVTKDHLFLLEGVRDSIVLTDANLHDITEDTNGYIIVNDPQLLHYKLASLYTFEPKFGIHPTAIVSDLAKISDTAYIGPYCILEACEIGEYVQLMANVTVRNNVIIKEHTVIEGNSVIGARGMAWIWDENGHRVIQPQMGGVIIGSHCLIGTDITIVRGSLTENTIVGDNTIMAHGTKIGHGTRIGNEVHIANNVSLAGNAEIGDRTFLGSACVISSNVKVAQNCIVGAGAVVSKSVDVEFVTLAGVPAKIIKTENFKNKPKGAPKPYNKK